MRIPSGVIREDVKNLILSNLRLRVVSAADMTAHAEAARVGERRVERTVQLLVPVFGTLAIPHAAAH